MPLPPVFALLADVEIPDELRPWLAAAVAGYLVIIFAMAWWAQGRVDTPEDYVVAGRRLGLWLSTGTLLATWFGAGTLMTAADEVRARGVEAATLDPVGAGLCLILAGLVFAGPLWREKLVTLPELFERRFGRAERRLGAALMIPTYLGWVAAQFAALAGLIELFFGLPFAWALVAVAAVGIAYTTLGGMWAVALTDALQIGLTIVGLVGIAWAVAAHLGDGDAARGVTETWARTPPELRGLLPQQRGAVAGWLSVLAAGALGNLASQDLFQRVFAARSARVARAACLISGAAYLVLGLIPIALGLAGRSLFGPDGSSTIPALAGLFLHPAAAVGFVVTLLSVVLSTIDSALLAPAAVTVRDLWGGASSADAELRAMRLGVVSLGLASLALAFIGESAYALLESGYELGMVALLVPLCLAVFWPGVGRAAALASMLLGTAVWTVHLAVGLEGFAGVEAIPVGLACTALSVVAAVGGAAWAKRSPSPGDDDPRRAGSARG